VRSNEEQGDEQDVYPTFVIKSIMRYIAVFEEKRGSLSHSHLHCTEGAYRSDHDFSVDEVEDENDT